MKAQLAFLLTSALLAVTTGVFAQPILDFGRVEIGHDSLMFAPIEGEDSTLFGAYEADAPFYCLPASWHFATRLHFKVAFAPPAEGFFEGELRYFYDDTVRMVALRGEGVLPTTTSDPDLILQPSAFSLSASPNPFNPATEIRFSLPQSGFASLVVYDLLGHQVALLLNGTVSSGEHAVHFDASALPSGLYFAHLKSASHQAATKLLLVR